MPTKKQPKPKSYQEQREIWYKKLAKSGFEDIEVDEHQLKTPGGHNKFSKLKTETSYYAKMEYYSMAGQFLNSYTFKNRLEKIVWEYFANGLSVRNISAVLQKTKVVDNKFDRNKVWNILKPLIHEMKRRYVIGYK